MSQGRMNYEVKRLLCCVGGGTILGAAILGSFTDAPVGLGVGVGALFGLCLVAEATLKERAAARRSTRSDRGVQDTQP